MISSGDRSPNSITTIVSGNIRNKTGRPVDISFSFLYPLFLNM